MKGVKGRVKKVPAPKPSVKAKGAKSHKYMAGNQVGKGSK